MKNMEIIKEFNKRNQKLCQCRQEDGNNLHIQFYGGTPYYSSEEGVKVISAMIQSEKPFFIGRLGETELRTMDCYERLWYNPILVHRVNRDICVNAGFFPKRVNKIKEYCDLKKSTLKNMDALGMCLWKNEEYYVSKYMKLDACFLGNILDPLYWENSWTLSLKGKKVLVIHPFADTILNQYYSKKNYLFSNNGILPDFKLITLKAVQSIGGAGTSGYADWFEALEYMKGCIKELDFDIALLGCGAYGLPLAAYVKQLGKQAIYVGGALQLMFGIMGKRWENEEHVSRYINKYWVRPSGEEMPKDYKKVEEGCYW